MNTLYQETIGEGDRHLVLLHGWGLNAEVWRYTAERLAPQFCLHLIDLPGYGRSEGFGAMTLEEMAETVLAVMPPKASLMGIFALLYRARRLAGDPPRCAAGFSASAE